MMNRIYTIGFTKKSAKVFFNILKENKIKHVLDIRLNNTSQLAGFAKYPNIEFFLSVIDDINYIQAKIFAPNDRTLKRFKKKEISWDEYKLEFAETMIQRNIGEYIRNNFNDLDDICLLCSEEKPTKCHRSLVAIEFKKEFETLTIMDL